MSISDLIIVMKDGVVQQIGKPQEVYDNPVNLFVAKFLGTPPINVFRVRVQDGKLMIGSDAVMNVSGVEDQPVYAAVRPEGFLLREEGGLCCGLNRDEVMVRDVSVVCTNEACEAITLRAIISSENEIREDAEQVRFDLKPGKVFLYHEKTQERIAFEMA